MKKIMKYTGIDYRTAVDRALLFGARTLELVVPSPLSAYGAVELYRTAEKCLFGLETRYDFRTNMKIQVSSSRLERTVLDVA